MRLGLKCLECNWYTSPELLVFFKVFFFVFNLYLYKKQTHKKTTPRPNPDNKKPEQNCCAFYLSLIPALAIVYRQIIIIKKSLDLFFQVQSMLGIIDPLFHLVCLLFICYALFWNWVSNWNPFEDRWFYRGPLT